MNAERAAPTFAVIPGTAVYSVLRGNEPRVVDLVADAYRLHAAGETVNPPSHFLRFADRPTARIIALPASLGGPAPVDGLKWISSFPANVDSGLPRASAVLILNDHDTGYPIACLESSIISASRTAASAALAAHALSGARGAQRPARLGIVGTGLIARYVHTYLAATGWRFTNIGLYDVVAAHADAFAAYLARDDGTRADASIVRCQSLEELVRSSDLIVFATVAGEPHVHEPAWFAHGPLVLHLSLRDLAPRVVLGAVNILDDVEHCLTAQTSPHLAEQMTGSRDFVHGTLVDVLGGRVAVPADLPVVFSPFGLGVLDLAVGRYVYDTLRLRGELDIVDGFFHELRRYG